MDGHNHTSWFGGSFSYVSELAINCITMALASVLVFSVYVDFIGARSFLRVSNLDTSADFYCEFLYYGKSIK